MGALVSLDHSVQVTSFETCIEKTILLLHVGNVQVLWELFHVLKFAVLLSDSVYLVLVFLTLDVGVFAFLRVI